MILICPLNNELGLITKVGAKTKETSWEESKSRQRSKHDPLMKGKFVEVQERKPNLIFALGVGSFEML
jgi:hypothetical protein